MARACDICKQPYYRRNVTELWESQAPGKREGWEKRTTRVCVWCMRERLVHKMLAFQQRLMATRMVRMAAKRERKGRA